MGQSPPNNSSSSSSTSDLERVLLILAVPAIIGFVVYGARDRILAWAVEMRFLVPEPLVHVTGGVGLGASQLLALATTALAVGSVACLALRMRENARADETTPWVGPRSLQLLKVVSVASGIAAPINVFGAHLGSSIVVIGALNGVVVGGGLLGGGADARAAARRQEETNRLVAYLSPAAGWRSPSTKQIEVTWDDAINLAIELTLKTSGSNVQPPDKVSAMLRGYFDSKYNVTSSPRSSTITARLDATNTEKEALPIARLREVVLDEFGPGATLSSVELSSKTCLVDRFDVTYDSPRKVASGFRKRKIEALIAEVCDPETRWRARWDTAHCRVHFETRPELEPMVYNRPHQINNSLDEALANYDKAQFVYAVDEDGEKIVWEPSKVPHTLAAGKTGAGKTSFIHSLITQASLMQWSVVIVDFKGDEFNDYRNWPNVQIVANGMQESISVINFLWELMNSRNTTAANTLTHNSRLNDVPVLFVIDEFTTFRKRLTDLWSKKKHTKAKLPPTLEQIADLFRLSRSSRMHGVIGMQRPDGDVIDTEARDNLGNRASVGPLTTIGAQMVWDSAYVGRDIPTGLRGRGMAFNRRGRPVEVQYFFTPKPGDESLTEAQREVVAALRPQVSSHERIVVEIPVETGAEDEEIDYGDYMEAPLHWAKDRPDLDRLSPQYAGPRVPISKYDISASMALQPTAKSSTGGAPAHAARPAVAPTTTVETVEPVDWDEENWEESYKDSAAKPARDLEPGEAFQLEDDSEEWVVVADEVLPDEAASGYVLVPWATPDGADDGEVSLPADEYVHVRVLR